MPKLARGATAVTRLDDPLDARSLLTRRTQGTVLDTPVWKVIATISVILLLVSAVLVLRRLTEPKPEEYSPASYVRRLLMPAAMIMAIFGAKFLVSEQINVIGTFAEMVEFTLAIVFYFAAAWATWFAIFVVMEWIISSRGSLIRASMPILLRLLARIVGILAVASIAAYGAQQLGLPVLGVLAGLGVGGLRWRWRPRAASRT